MTAAVILRLIMRWPASKAMKRKISIKTRLLAIAVLIIILVAVISPEHAETVARAFIMLFGAPV